MIPSNGMPQLSLSDKIIYLLFQIIAVVFVMPMISMEARIFVFIEVILDLHKYLIKRIIQGCVLLTPS